jgi:hypothetical protein
MFLGTLMNAGFAAAQPVRAFDRLEASRPAIPSRDAVGPRQVLLGLARGASVETQNARTIRGYSVSKVATATSSVDEFLPGVVGGLLAALVGGALGFLYVKIHEDNGVEGPLNRPVLTGALIGLFVEWVARSGPDPAPSR